MSPLIVYFALCTAKLRCRQGWLAGEWKERMFVALLPFVALIDLLINQIDTYAIFSDIKEKYLSLNFTCEPVSAQSTNYDL